jgi:ABC-type glycerol-3-phosphate transport system substrate-binding protein
MTGNLSRRIFPVSILVLAAGLMFSGCGGSAALAHEKAVIDTVNRFFISTDNRDWDRVKGLCR